jgi:hypothetical protein
MKLKGAGGKFNASAHAPIYTIADDEAVEVALVQTLAGDEVC